MRRFWSGYLLASPLILVTVALLLLPMGTFLVYSFMTTGMFRVGLPLTLNNYRRVFTDPFYWRLMGNSVYIGMITAVVSIVLGYVVAYYTRFLSGRFQTTVLALTVISILGGYLVRIYAWRIILGSEGILNTTLTALGFSGEPLRLLLFSRTAIVIALVNIYIPFTMITVFSALENIGDDLVEAARDLGASQFVAFRKVILPLTGNAVFTSFLFVFLLTAADYITPQLIGGVSGSMIGVIVQDQFVKLGNYGMGATLSFFVVLVFGGTALTFWLALRTLGVLRGDAEQ